MTFTIFNRAKIMDKPSYYAIIPANVRYDNNLKANEKLLYGEISALCSKDGVCYATNEYFANLYNVSKKSISTWINELAQRKYIYLRYLYKKGTLELERRLIYLIDPIEKKFYTYGKKSNIVMEEKFCTSMEKNVKDNDTSNEYYKYNISNAIIDNQNLEENSDFLEIAKGLQSMVESKKRMKVSKIQLLNWSKEIKSLFSIISKIRGSDQALDDIKKAVQFLIDHSGEEYIPVVESGKSFKDKFSKVEDAIKRQKKLDFMKVDVNNLGWEL